MKRVTGDDVAVEADLVADGHDVLGGWVLFRPERNRSYRAVPLELVENDRYRASFPVEEIGSYRFRVVAWVDEVATFLRGFRKKVDAGVDVTVELLEASEFASKLARRGAGDVRAELEALAVRLRNQERSPEERAGVLLESGLDDWSARLPDLEHASRSETYEVLVERPRARFSSWYELFPRSCGEPGKHGTLRDVQDRLPYVREMGFDVLYLPPIHPIGRTFRKGKNNSLQAEPDDVGSPWAVGAEEGGHKAVHPELGTLEDLRELVRASREHGIELALDIAFQASPDHPWVKEHPEWFVQRPDGSIQYAENPPKKYQDIYPINFQSEDWRGLWRELKSVFEFWIAQGITIFRVDNPHTKSLRFWEWCIRELRSECPELIMLSEAFTRPKLMYKLAKVGFTQSYTYFTWRHTKWEFEQYLGELTSSPVSDFFRPNFWPNTPDILPPYFTSHGRPAFLSRMVLASTLSSSWGIYGPAFELQERAPRPGVEEYLDNEKYELRDWDLEKPGTLRPLIGKINALRRRFACFQRNDSLRFHQADNEQLICYSRSSDNDAFVVVVSLDPLYPQSGFINIDLESLGLQPGASYEAHDLLNDAKYTWGARNYVSLEPTKMPAHILRVR